MEFMVLRRARQLPKFAAPKVPERQVEPIVADLSPKDVRDLARDDRVEKYAPSVPIKLVKPMGLTVGQTPLRGKCSWGIDAIGASNCTLTGEGVTVAVLDTGIDQSHPCFKGVVFEPWSKNFTQGSETDIADQHGHGTHVAGTLFGRDIDGYRIGVACGVTKAVICKVLGPGGGSTGNLFSAMNWALVQEASIISMSLGMDLVSYEGILISGGMHPTQAKWQAMYDAIANVRFFDAYGGLMRAGRVFNRPALVVAASGNQSDRYGEQTGSPYVLNSVFPAESEEFLSVGALEQTRNPPSSLRVANFSNKGAKLVAPGVSITSAKLGGGIETMSGTSMAVPHVAGLAALWAQKLVGGSPTSPIDLQRVVTHLKHSCQLPAGMLQESVGHGLPRAPLL